ncbi:MAG TPA: hypothetical protein VHH36_03685, partial [Candidatus Thermoplasmatota archaeon]|nr:hypothetical protein [Candidatus Thermoplasmatota archaeon]
MDLQDVLRSADAQLRLDLVSPPLPRVAPALPPLETRLEHALAAAALGHALRAELARRQRLAPP